MGNIKDVLEGYVEVGKFNSRIIKKLDDSIMYSLASIVGSKKRDVGVVIFWILVIIIGVPILFIFAG